MSPWGVVRLRVACPQGEGTCRVRLRLRRGGRSLAAGTWAVEAGTARVVRLELSRWARRRLDRRPVLRVTAVAVTLRAGTRGTTRKSIRILAPRGAERGLR